MPPKQVPLDKTQALPACEVPVKSTQVPSVSALLHSHPTLRIFTIQVRPETQISLPEQSFAVKQAPLKLSAVLSEVLVPLLPLPGVKEPQA